MQNLLFSHLLSKNVKMKIYRTVILPVFYTGLQLGITLREEHWVRVFKRDMVTGDWRKLQSEV
jgi:hypothetical protein